MKLSGYAFAMGLGIAAGAVVSMMLPRDCTARKMVCKAADAVEDAAMNVGDMISDKLDSL